MILNCQGGQSCIGDGFSGDVKLDIICVAVNVETMAADDGTKGEHVEDKQKKTRHLE